MFIEVSGGKLYAFALKIFVAFLYVGHVGDVFEGLIPRLGKEVERVSWRVRERRVEREGESGR